MKRLFSFFTLPALAALLATSCVDNPAEVAVTGVKLSDKEIELIEGQTHNLTATVLPDNATNKNVTWTSLVPDVATVGDDGTVVAMAMGASTITVRTVDGGFTADCAVIVKMRVIPVESISLNYDKIGINEGSEVYLSATVLPANATNKNVKWSASPENVLSVDGSGHVTGLIPGEGYVTATTEDGGFTATCHIIVNPVIVNAERVTLDKETLELTEGETAVLTATVLPENTTDKTLEWRTSDENVATVDQEGKVTAIDSGKAWITASCGVIEASCEVTVKKVEVTDLTIEPTSVTLTEGETIQLSASISPADADQTVEWASIHPAIATVDMNSGLVTAVSEGETRIYARSKYFTNVQAYCEVKVTPDPSLKGISLSSSVMTLQVGESKTLSVSFNPPYAANKNVTWTSTSTAVAAVSQEGVVTAFSEGNATVTAVAEDGGYSASCEVTVSGAAGPMVYYWVDGVCYLNGAPDPRNGIFDTQDLKLLSYGATGADCVGKTLYTIETYKVGKDFVPAPYLCKDREPMIQLPKSFNDKEIHALCAQDDYYAFLTGVSQITLWKGKYDGTLEEIPVSGSYIDIFSPHMATLPDGSIIIAARIKDAFGKSKYATYTVSKENIITEKIFANAISGDINISVADNGDVYAFVVDYDTNDYSQYLGYLYKNEELVASVDKISQYNIGAVACNGNSVYTAVNDLERQETRIHKDGTLLYSISTDFIIHYHHNRPMVVTKTGDVYLALYRPSNSALYKNGKLLYSANCDAFRFFCIVE